MKKIFYAGLLLLAAACTTKQSAFVPGTYVHHAESKFSVADDTLIITPDYQLTRRAGYLRKGDNSPRRLVKVFKGTWQEDKGVLELLPAGIQIRFQPGGLVMDNIQYRKL